MDTTFDSNAWYNIYYGDPSDDTALQAFTINDSGTGSVASTLYDSNSSTTYQWQVLPLGTADTYALRAKFLGNRYYIGAFWSPAASLPGMDTRLRTERYSSPDQVPTRVQWVINSTDDGTSTNFISNVDNGTSWYLDNGAGVAYMRAAADFDTTNGMKWTFSSVSAINDADWSYSATSTTSTSTTSQTSTSTPNSNAAASVTPTTTPTPSASADASTADTKAPTGAIVGGIVGGIAFLLLLVGLLGFYLRRRKRAAAHAYSQPGSYTGPNELEGRPIFSSRFGTIMKVKIQRSRSPIREKHPAYRAWENAVELPSETATTRS